MQGYVTRKGRQWYAVVYEGLDPATGRERRRWHRAGTVRAQAEALARQLAIQERQRRGDGRGQLTFAGFVGAPRCRSGQSVGGHQRERPGVERSGGPCLSGPSCSPRSARRIPLRLDGWAKRYCAKSAHLSPWPGTIEFATMSSPWVPHFPYSPLLHVTTSLHSCVALGRAIPRVARS